MTPAKPDSTVEPHGAAQVGIAPSRAAGVPTAVRRPPAARAQQRPTRDPHWMVNQLPVGMLDDPFFVRFVSLFQELARPLLEDADNVERVVDPTIAPEPLLRWIGSWIGLNSVDPQLPSELQRLIVRSSGRTLGWRGTRAGLTEFLEMTSGGPAEVTDAGGVWREGAAPADPAFVRMSVAGTGWLTEKDFIALLRDEIPAHVRAELWVAGRLAWSSATEAEL